MVYANSKLFIKHSSKHAAKSVVGKTKADVENLLIKVLIKIYCFGSGPLTIAEQKLLI